MKARITKVTKSRVVLETEDYKPGVLIGSKISIPFNMFDTPEKGEEFEINIEKIINMENRQ